MSDRKTPKAKLTNEQYLTLLCRISKIHKELDKMNAMIREIEADRQSKDENDECYDLYYIDNAIRFGQKNIH